MRTIAYSVSVQSRTIQSVSLRDGNQSLRSERSLCVDEQCLAFATASVHR